jgi:hypothetical protein
VKQLGDEGALPPVRIIILFNNHFVMIVKCLKNGLRISTKQELSDQHRSTWVSESPKQYNSGQQSRFVPSPLPEVAFSLEVDMFVDDWPQEFQVWTEKIGKNVLCLPGSRKLPK